MLVYLTYLFQLLNKHSANNLGESSSTKNTLLSLTIGEDYLESVRRVPTLKNAAYGSAKNRINTVGKLIGQ